MSQPDIDPGEFPDWRKRSRLDSCADGMCGGCPNCLEAQGITEDEGTDE